MPGRAHLCAVSPAGQACTVPDAEAQVLPTVHKSGPVHQHLRPCTVTRACAPLLWPVHSRVGEVHRHVRLCSRSVGLYATDRTPRVRRSGTGPSGGAQVPVSVHTPGPVHRHVGLCTATLVCAPPPWPVQSRVGLCRVTSACAPSRQLVQPSVGFCTFGSCAECRGPAQLPAAVHTSGPVLRRVGLFTTTLACAPPPWPVRSRVGNVHRHDRLCSRRAACARSGRRPSSQVLHRSEGRCTTPGVGATRPGLCTVTSACAPTADLVQRHCGLWDGGVGCVQADGLCSGGWFAGGRLGREGELGGEEGAGLD